MFMTRFGIFIASSVCLGEFYHVNCSEASQVDDCWGSVGKVGRKFRNTLRTFRGESGVSSNFAKDCMGDAYRPGIGSVLQQSPVSADCARVLNESRDAIRVLRKRTQNSLEDDVSKVKLTLGYQSSRLQAHCRIGEEYQKSVSEIQLLAEDVIADLNTAY